MLSIHVSEIIFILRVHTILLQKKITFVAFTDGLFKQIVLD